MYLIEREKIEKYTVKGKTYSGIMYPVRFRVNKPLKLSGFQFCGLHSQSKGTGSILGLRIGESMFNDIARTFHEEYMARTYYAIQGEKDAFAFKLPQPVAVPQNTFLEVGFQLDPVIPEETASFQYLQAAATGLQDLMHKESGVLFEFFQSSSQLCGIFFEMNADPVENQPTVPYKMNTPDMEFHTCLTCCSIL